MQITNSIHIQHQNPFSKSRKATPIGFANGYDTETIISMMFLKNEWRHSLLLFVITEKPLYNASCYIANKKSLEHKNTFLP